MHIELLEPSIWLTTILNDLDKRGITLTQTQIYRLLNTYTKGFFALMGDAIYAQQQFQWDEDIEADRQLEKEMQECEQQAQEAVKGFYGDKTGKKK